MGHPSFVASTSALKVSLEPPTFSPPHPSSPAQAPDLQVLLLPMLRLWASQHTFPISVLSDWPSCWATVSLALEPIAPSGKQLEWFFHWRLRSWAGMPAAVLDMPCFTVLCPILKSLQIWCGLLPSGDLSSPGKPSLSQPTFALRARSTGQTHSHGYLCYTTLPL